jgi:hypothetical protein
MASTHTDANTDNAVIDITPSQPDEPLLAAGTTKPSTCINREMIKYIWEEVK